MKQILFVPSFLLILVLLYLPSKGASELPKAVSEAMVPESRNQLIKLTDAGVDPLEIRMKKEDSIAFFLNQSVNSLPTLEIDFHDLTTHCSSSNLKIGEDGKIRSQKPIGADDFASTCFHEQGTYDFVVHGLLKKPSGIKGRIIVE